MKTNKPNDPRKKFNRFYRGDKVLIVSSTYVWGLVVDVAIKESKKYAIKRHIVYKVLINDTELRTFTEEALMPFLPKWQYKIIKFFGIAV